MEIMKFLIGIGIGFGFFCFYQFKSFVFHLDSTAWQSEQSKTEMVISLGGDTQCAANQPLHCY